jgi:hypothetical protein
VKVLFTTGYTRFAPRHDGSADPGGPVLPKPFTVEQLDSKIRGILDAGIETAVAH